MPNGHLIATTCGVGGASAATDNLGQVADSPGYKTHTIATFISLVGVWNFLGGVLASFASAILSETFGLEHFSTLYSVGSVSSPIGSYIFYLKVAGNSYDKEALKQMEDSDLEREAGKELNCSGVHCFRKAFVMVKAATFLGFLVSIILVYGTRRFNKGDIYKKFREEAVVTEADGVVPSGETEARAKVGANAGRYPHLHNHIQPPLNY